MTLNNIKITVIIVSYNQKKWQDKCYSSLKKCALALDIIVIDNGSTDGTQEIIRLKYPEVNLIQSKENLGFGKANNLAIDLAIEQGADYVFLMNHDTWLADNCIENIISNFEVNNKEYGILSPVHYSGNTVDYDKGFLNYCSQEMLENNKEKIIVDVPLINGAFMMISKNCLKKVKHFDPIFYFYGEDVDFCKRITNAGFKIGVVKNAIAYHDRKERELTAERLYNHIKANHLLQIKTLSKNGFFTAYIKTFVSAIISLFKNLFKPMYFLQYLKNIFYLITNFFLIKNQINKYE